MNPRFASFPRKEPNPLSLSGFGLFFTPRLLDTAELSVRGIGVREWMPPSFIERPQGMGDFLIMLFHDPALISNRPGNLTVSPSQTMMIWPPGSGHYYGNRGSRFCHTWIHCEGSRVRQMIRRGNIPLLKPFPVSNPIHFEQGLLEIHGELVSQTEPDAVIVGNVLEKSLRQLVRKPDSSRKVKISGSLLAAHQLLLTGPAQKITLDGLAKAAGMSSPYFCSLFTKAFRISPMECLVKHRMYRASRLLLDSDLRIAQIAFEIGYEDPFHFSKMFKKHFGSNPRLFRSKHLSGNTSNKRLKKSDFDRG